VQHVALPALRHRLIMNFEGQAEGITTDEIVREIVARVLEAAAPKVAV